MTKIMRPSGETQYPNKIIIDLKNVSPIKEIKKEFLYLFYSRYLDNYEKNELHCLTQFIACGGNKEEFKMPVEVERALWASFKRQLLRQYKVETLDEMLSKQAFTYINTVVLQSTVREIFRKGVDKDFVTMKIKQYKNLYKRPRRNEVLEIIFENNTVEKIIEFYEKIIDMPEYNIEQIHAEISEKIRKGEISKAKIIEDYERYNPNHLKTNSDRGYNCTKRLAQ